MTNPSGGGLLVYLYGPPASGKLTVARALVARTGLRLFHNHLTVDALTPVFDRHSDTFTAVLHRFRLDVFENAAATGVDVLFTNNSAWGGHDGRARLIRFTQRTREVVESNGGQVVFVQLRAPDEALHARLEDPSRLEHGKLLDHDRLDALLATHDPSPLHPDDLVIDTEQATPADAATQIARIIGRWTPVSPGTMRPGP